MSDSRQELQITEEIERDVQDYIDNQSKCHALSVTWLRDYLDNEYASHFEKRPGVVARLDEMACRELEPNTDPSDFTSDVQEFLKDYISDIREGLE